MNEKRTSFPQRTVRISGNLEKVEEALLDKTMLGIKKTISTETQAIAELEPDKNRIPIYLGAVTDTNQIWTERGAFFARIDGSYYGNSPKVDTQYCQGDYTSGLAEAIPYGFLPESMGEHEFSEDLEALGMAVAVKHESVLFGYVNDSGVPCGMQIYRFNDEKGQPHYIISHVDNLDKPKAERHTTVYMDNELYQRLNGYHYFHLAEVTQKTPNAVNQSSLTPNALPQDLFNLVNCVQLSHDLRRLFGDKGSPLTLSYGGYEGERKKHEVGLSHPKEIVPINLVAEPMSKPPQVQPYELFCQAANHHVKNVTQGDHMIEANQVLDLVSQQWSKYITNFLANLPPLESGRVSQLFNTNEFKQKLLVQQKCTELEKLREDIANQKVDNPAEAVGRVLNAMAVSGNSPVSNYVVEQRQQFKLMESTERDYKAAVLAENKKTLDSWDPAPANELANSGSSIGSESGDDPEEESDHKFSM